MPDLRDGETVEIQGSAAKPYLIKNVGGVYSCSCPAWRNQSRPIDRRSCKHIRAWRGEQAEAERIGGEAIAPMLPAIGKRTAPPLLLAQTWDGEKDLTDWFWSEKLDGVRAYWNGDGEFLSRQGNKFYAPSWFTARLPKIPLDGELWLDRKAFQRTVSIVRRQNAGEQWRGLRYVVFDAPQQRAPFEERLAIVRDALAGKQQQFAVALPHFICRGNDHLQQELDHIARLGGEGVMLRMPGSAYEAGRSDTLLKVKRFLDAEARVIGHEPGKGRHKGRLGALALELANGKQFSVGTGLSDAERDNPPPVGSTITFRYQELSDGGVPRFPSFVRVRNEVASAPPLAPPA